MNESIKTGPLYICHETDETLKQQEHNSCSKLPSVSKVQYSFIYEKASRSWSLHLNGYLKTQLY